MYNTQNDVTALSCHVITGKLMQQNRRSSFAVKRHCHKVPGDLIKTKL